MAKLVLGTDINNTGTSSVVVEKPTPMPLSIQFRKDSNNTLLSPNTIMDLTGINDIGSNCLTNLFANKYLEINNVDFSSITKLSYTNSCYQTFYNCTGITSIDLSNLTIISGDYACKEMFKYCSSVTNLNLSNLIQVTGSYACQDMFSGDTSRKGISITSLDLHNLKSVTSLYGLYHAFYSCQELKTVDLSSLEVVSGANGLRAMFWYCKKLTDVNLSSLKSITGNGCLSWLFEACTSLTEVSFPALTSNSFGSYTNQFNCMLSSVIGCTVHFPSNLQSVIGSWSDVTAGFGGTNITVLFDLPATE